MLRIGGRVAELRVTLAGLDEQVFSSLFEPEGGRPAVALGRHDARVLGGFGLVSPRSGGFIGEHRVRRQGPRFYVMELGGVEYYQDIWPETDALLDELETLAPGTLLDMGTGCGIVAVEAAARGHQVTATDLYDSALTLARFNAALNGAGEIDFRVGHLFEPVAGQTFAAILTAPHYGRVHDQLRLETLRTGVERVAEGGRLVLATNLEWTDDQPPAIAPTLLEPLAQGGFDIDVQPIVSARKRTWFHRARGLPGLVSRHRFLVRLQRRGDQAAGQVRITLPAGDQPEQLFVPLSRLAEGAHAAIEDAADVARLSDVVAQLGRGALVLDGPPPLGLLDACRFGARVCMTEEKLDPGRAAGAILDAQGGVRPCTRGEPMGRVGDSLQQLVDAQHQAGVALRERRGCATCSALVYCSRCQFPVVLDEQAYCDFMRAHPAGIERLKMLLELLSEVSREGTLGDRLRVKAWGGAPLLFAHDRPRLAPTGERPQPTLTARWRGALTWVVGLGADRHLMSWVGFQNPAIAEIDPLTAEIAELVADDATHAELEAYVRGRQLPSRMLERSLVRISQNLPPD